MKKTSSAVTKINEADQAGQGGLWKEGTLS